MRIGVALLMTFLCSMAAQAEEPEQVLALDGEWQFALDPADAGIEQGWHGRELPDAITLPGTVVGNGFGNEITVDTEFLGHIFHEWYDDPRYAPYREPGNIKIPSFLQPPKHYVGPAWFRRNIEIPESWRGREVEVFLERCQFESSLWIDGRCAGSHNSLSTPHVYMLGQLDPGTHELAIRVTNESVVNVGVAHAANDWMQKNWNGMVGRLELRALPLVRVEHMQLYPDAAARAVRVRVVILNHTGRPQSGHLDVSAALVGAGAKMPAAAQREAFFVTADRAYVDALLPLGEDAQLWDEFSPDLYEVEAALTAGPYVHAVKDTCGLRDIDIEGRMFLVNGRLTMMRGTHEAANFPITGHASMDLDEWRRVVARCKQFGLNHMRFHSWCPPEAAFVAADEQGFYFQVEGPFNCEIGSGTPVDEYLPAELDRILDTYGNHPSFVLMAHGNEPQGPGKEALLAKEVSRWKQKDARHRYTAGSGWPMLPENEYHCNHNPRLQLWGEGLQSRINSVPPNTHNSFDYLYETYDRPMLIHEMGQWCVYPDFGEISKYTGLLKPKNFEIFRDFLEAGSMGHLADAFHMASGKLQVICYKEEIEHTLRTQDCAGFQLLDLMDYSGQGTSLVGVLDAFRDPKKYIDADAWRRFCSETVPLARFKQRTWTTDDVFEADIEVTHFGAEPIKRTDVYWQLIGEDGSVFEEGVFDNRDIPIGHVQPVGRIRLALENVAAPQHVRLVAGIQGTPFENDWGLWIYPPAEPATPEPSDVLVVEKLTAEVEARLEAGGKVLLAPDPRYLSTPVQTGFSNMFWNVSFTNNQAPHTVGLLCEPDHPVFGAFPTSYHTDWQWWQPLRNSAALVLDDLPPKLDILVRPIDSFFYARRLSLLFEASVGEGKLMVCSMDLAHDLDTRHAARQLRRSILDYMASDAFAPSVQVELEALHGLLKPAERESTLGNMGAEVIDVSAEVPAGPAANILDGSPNTIWLSNKQYQQPYPPHFFVIDMKDSVNLAGVVYLPRQDSYGGRVGEYALYLSDDGADWGAPVAEGQWPDSPDEQRIVFPEPVRARYLRFVAKTEVHTWTYVSVAELDVIVDWRE